MDGFFKETIDFIRFIYHKPEGVIPLHAPVFTGNEKKYVEECLDSTFVSSVGKYVSQFEDQIADYTGAKKAVACVNGTSALHLALKIMGVTVDTEVLTQPLTFIATINAISYCNAHPVFLDVDKDTMGLSPEALLHFLKKETYYNASLKKLIHKRTDRSISACVPMHTFGHPCRIDQIVKICDEYNIPVVEDAAESLGSYFKGHHTGTFGKVGILSFNGNKILTTGGGGMLLFQDEDLAKYAKHLTTQAKLPHPWEFIHDEIGYNYRMPNINAALGLAQLEKLDRFLHSKKELAIEYDQFFKRSPVEFVREPEFASSNYWLNGILFKNLEERNSFLEYSNAAGVMTRPVWHLINRLPCFKNCLSIDLKNSEWLADRLVNIPSSARV